MPVPPHSLGKAREEIDGVVGTGCGLGMVLDAEAIEVVVAKPFYGSVVEVDVGDASDAPQAVGVYGEAVVVGCDRDARALQLHDRLVTAAVAELELVGAAAQGEREEL